MASPRAVEFLPRGSKTFTTVPEVFFIPEFVFGGLVWILVASTHVYPDNPLGWVMFVSVFCFVMTTIFFFFFILGHNQRKFWNSLDVGYHFVAVVLYLSASVILAYITLLKGWGMTIAPGNLIVNVLTSDLLKIYRLDIAAVVMSYLATLLYFLHAIFSARRWHKSR
ncbi:myelin and lymphocyte protein-like [Takifugu rubripes]|uniref:Myelin and lymphocyte protein n=1 Tax=Takifugu rubripes TaxID=31033 RepID=A0A674P0X4_TAKRU|nr:myelin and lymphocyte protein-like [Takifugu rubripes]XP_029691200.1 myelin and lymphocyte protein-like [Takifugu rubripes]